MNREQGPWDRSGTQERELTGTHDMGPYKPIEEPDNDPVPERGPVTPDPYPVTDPVPEPENDPGREPRREPEPFPTPPEPLPEYPPDVTFRSGVEH